MGGHRRSRSGRGGVGTATQTIPTAGGLLPAVVCGYVEHGMFHVDSAGQASTGKRACYEARTSEGSKSGGASTGEPGAIVERHYDL